MNLFIRLYLDEDVDVLLAALIAARGFEAETTVGAGKTWESDLNQLLHAAATGHVLLTHNRVDFERLASDWNATGRHHAGIIVAVRRSPYEIARRLLILMNDMTAEEAVDEVIYI